MTRTYQYTFRRYYPSAEDITITKRVTDRMEERDSWKRAYAMDYFTRYVRETLGIKNAVLNTRYCKDITK